jgi:carboxyl-terminal processing protease
MRLTPAVPTFALATALAALLGVAAVPASAQEAPSPDEPVPQAGEAEPIEQNEPNEPADPAARADARTDEEASSLPLAEIRRYVAVYNAIRQAYVDPVEDADLMQSAIRGLLLDLDPHSAYLDRATPRPSANAPAAPTMVSAWN